MRAIGVQRDRRIVIKPRRAPLEERSNNRHLQLARHFGEPFRRWPRDRLGQIEEARVFALAKILRAKSSGRQTIFAPCRAASRCAPPPRRSSPPGRAPCASAPAPLCICAFSIIVPANPSISGFQPCSKANPASRNWPRNVPLLSLYLTLPESAPRRQWSSSTARACRPPRIA